jgi:predicted small lipoprotein YifL
MRLFLLLSAVIVLGALAGCGKEGPAVPRAMTAEEEQKFQDDERKAANEETRHQVERRNHRPLTPEQQAEMAERQHRRR